MEMAYIQAENLKHKRTFTKTLIVLAPFVTCLLYTSYRTSSVFFKLFIKSTLKITINRSMDIFSIFSRLICNNTFFISYAFTCVLRADAFCLFYNIKNFLILQQITPCCTDTVSYTHLLWMLFAEMVRRDIKWRWHIFRQRT